MLGHGCGVLILGALWIPEPGGRHTYRRFGEDWEVDGKRSLPRDLKLYDREWDGGGRAVMARNEPREREDRSLLVQSQDKLLTVLVTQLQNIAYGPHCLSLLSDVAPTPDLPLIRRDMLCCICRLASTATTVHSRRKMSACRGVVRNPALGPCPEILCISGRPPDS